jgi:hypothetical protein
MKKVNPVIDTLCWYGYMEKPVTERSDEYNKTSDDYCALMDHLQKKIGGVGESKLFSDLDSAVGAYLAAAESDAYQAGFVTALNMLRVLTD